MQTVVILIDLICRIMEFNARISLCGAVVAQWIRPRTLNREIPCSNLLAAAV